MQPHLSLFSLTLLFIDLSASGGNQDTEAHANNPWQVKYTEPEEDSDIDYHETWGEGTGLHSAAPGVREQSGMVDYPAVVVGHGQDLYDPNTDTYVGQSERDHEHTARHHSRHLHNNRRRHARDQDTVSNSMIVEQSTEDSLVTMDPDEIIDTSNCTLCAVREANKQYRLEQIRKEILEKLRIERPPNITDKRLPQIPEISEWLSNFGDNQWDNSPRPNDPDEPVVRIISMLNLAQDPPASKQLPKMQNVCYFEFHPDTEPADIISATLGVFLRPVKYETNIVTMFLIYKVKPRRRGNPIIKRKRVRLNAEDTNKWYRFNVDAVVKNWVRNSANNYGLQIMVYDGDGESLAIVKPANSTEKLFKPYIELDIQEKRENPNRERRMLSLDCTEDSTTKSCCRYPMTLDFSGMGWDWVLAPKSVKVNYCSGECDVSYLTSPYQHFLNQNNGSEKQMIAACCIPKVYSGIKMMYFSEQDRIEIGVVNDIVVEKCGCT